jgi:hypothetical protein
MGGLLIPVRGGGRIDVLVAEVVVEAPFRLILAVRDSPEFAVAAEVDEDVGAIAEAEAEYFTGSLLGDWLPRRSDIPVTASFRDLPPSSLSEVTVFLASWPLPVSVPVPIAGFRTDRVREGKVDIGSW